MIGAVAIPLNTMWTSHEVKRAINDTHVEVLIVDTSSDATSWQTIPAGPGLADRWRGRDGRGAPHHVASWTGLLHMA